jgi:integrase
MGVKVKEKVAGSGVFWVFINHKGKRKSKCIGSEKAALEFKSIIEAKLKLGQPMTNNLRNRALHKCLEVAKLRTIWLHDLRHTFASLLIQNGESLAYVKDQMGHSSIKVTVDIYGHLVPGANRQAVNRLPTARGVPKRRARKNLA